MVASHEVIGLVFTVFGSDMSALLGGVGATCVEATTLRRICRRGNIATEHDAVHLNVGIGIGDRREERIGVRKRML